jgi:predicted phosphohydrolase
MDNTKVIKEILKNTSMEPKVEKKQPIITLKEIKERISVHKAIEQEKESEIVEILNNKEITEIKHEAINIMAMTHFHPVKRQLFANRLHNSGIVEDYVNNNLIFRAFNKANANIKFGIVYGINYLQTNNDYDRLVLLTKARQEEEKKITPAEEVPKVETPKAETENTSK